MKILSKSIENRIIALADALRRWQMEQAQPVDPLSASLFAWGQELAALDEQGKVELLEQLNQGGDDGTMGLDLDMDALEQMIDDWRNNG